MNKIVVFVVVLTMLLTSCARRLRLRPPQQPQTPVSRWIQPK